MALVKQIAVAFNLEFCSMLYRISHKLSHPFDDFIIKFKLILILNPNNKCTINFTLYFEVTK